MLLTLQREPGKQCTPGRLAIDGVPEADSLELPWENNFSMISCIPAGTYTLAWEPSPRLKRSTLRLKGVPGRWGILIHPANHVEELKGCIALGKRLAVDSLMESRIAVEAVEAKALAAMGRGEVVKIEVKDAVTV